MKEVKAMKRFLILAILPVAVGATGNCVTGPAEMGDIGPSFALVCNELERRFPGAALAVEDLAIHSATEVSVITSVDGRPIPMSYSLTGFSWTLNDAGMRTAEAGTLPTGLPAHR
jgi:hypothetical protein